MATNSGLRTEIVSSTVLLLGAALLFAGFLLVKLTERELLEERRFSLQRSMRLIAAAESAPARLNALLLPLSQDGGLAAWRLLDPTMLTVLSFTTQDGMMPDELPPSSLPAGELAEKLVYNSAWIPFATAPASYLELTVPLDTPAGHLLQARFSLAPVVEQVHRAQRLVLVYVVLYGAVLSGFGIYLLSRNVVEPVRRLRAATAGVAAGDLTPINAASGPGEIRQLADDFNSMVAALQASRAETAAHIASLEEANRALRQARDEVIRAEKMASVGHLAAGMAHEIGNPLSAVIGYLNLVRDELAEPAQRDLVERSLAEAGRIDRLVRDLLDYAAPAEAGDDEFDPAVVARDAVGLLTNQGALDGVAVNDRTPAELGTVRMDRNRFLQVCVNLLLNARDAMPEGGQLTLEGEVAGGDLLLTVADTGSGMPAQIRQRIFEPFFTTKDPGRGRGLGLAVSQRLVIEAGGRLDVESAPGQGSRFTICLPAAKEQR